jgi:hypothetical protein
MAGSFVTPALIKKFGMKTMIIIGSIFFCVVIVEQILPAWYQENIDDPSDTESQWYGFLINKTFIEVTQIVSAMLSGLGAAFIWVT